VDAEGVCSACRAYEKRSETDWDARWREFEALCDRHRRDDGRWDCIVTVSSGKDSFHQVATMVEKMGMHPLLLSVDNWVWTETGQRNADLMSDLWGCDLIKLSLPRKTARVMLRKAFFKQLAPTYYFDAAVYAWPPRMAMALGIPLVVYGEDVNVQYGGKQSVEKLSAVDQWDNEVVREVPIEEWCSDGIEPKHLLNTCIPPTRDEMLAAGIEPIYLSYAEPWSGFKNREEARIRGWVDLDDTQEWDRVGHAEGFDQLDSRGYGVHYWLRQVKYGHNHMTDVFSMWIREGRISREYAVEQVLAEEWKCDPTMLGDFLRFTGMIETEFWATVHEWANRDLLDYIDGSWRLNAAAAKALREGGPVTK